MSGPMSSTRFGGSCPGPSAQNGSTMNGAPLGAPAKLVVTPTTRTRRSLLPISTLERRPSTVAAVGDTSTGTSGDRAPDGPTAGLASAAVGRDGSGVCAISAAYLAGSTAITAS